MKNHFVVYLNKVHFVNNACISNSKEKRELTNLDKFGVKYPSQSKEIVTVMKQTNLQKYGVENPMRLENIKQKLKQTNLQKYGVENPMQIASISEKQFNNSFKYKTYKYPNGDTIKIQGYEPIAIDILLNIGYKQEDIVTSKQIIPEIWYKDTENKKHRYYCDIYIPSENRIIEVKSTWTYNKELHSNILKAETCKAEGYNFEFWIIDKDQNSKIISP